MNIGEHEHPGPDDRDTDEIESPPEHEDEYDAEDDELTPPIRERGSDFAMELPGTPITDYKPGPEHDEEQELKEEEDAGEEEAAASD